MFFNQQVVLISLSVCKLLVFVYDLSNVRIYGFYDECKRRYSLKLWKVEL
jgi:hypothetical protein